MRHLTYANVMATIAVFIALGGVSWAAVKLPRNSVGNSQLKKNAVTGAKVKAGSLAASDFASGQLPRGPQGLPGPQGLEGPQGERGATGPSNVVAYAKIAEDGSFVGTDNRKGFSGNGIQRIEQGKYCVGDQIDVSPKSVMVTPTASGFARVAQATLGDRGTTFPGCGTVTPADRQILINTFTSTNATYVDGGFTIWVVGD